MTEWPSGSSRSTPSYPRLWLGQLWGHVMLGNSAVWAGLVLDDCHTPSWLFESRSQLGILEVSLNDNVVYLEMRDPAPRVMWPAKGDNTTMVLTSVLEFSPGTQTTGLSATLPSPGNFSGPQPSNHSTDVSSNANLTVFGLDTSSGVPRFQNKRVLLHMHFSNQHHY